MKARTTVGITIPLLLLFGPAPLAGKADRQKTVHVDCTKGQSIQKALEDKAEDLVVEISGVSSCGAEPPEQIFFDQTFTLP